MRCPHCQAENLNTAKVCSSCGAQLASEQQTLKAVTTGGAIIGKAAREARIKEVVDPSAIISARAYNGTIGVMLLWGFLINYLMCRKIGSFTNTRTLFKELSWAIDDFHPDGL